MPKPSRTNRSNPTNETAQGLVEFALVLPLLLVLMFGVIELGRLLFIYTAVHTASREAVRYGSASGDSGGNGAYYQDCQGMRAAARRIGSMAGIQDGEIVIDYDSGPGTTTFGSCPVGGTGPAGLTLENRVRVQINTLYKPILTLVPLPSFPVTSLAARTTFTNVQTGGEGSEPPTTPRVNFTSPGYAIAENDPVGKIMIVVQLSWPISQNVTVPFTVEGTATGSGPWADYTINPGGSVVIPAGSTIANIEIQIRNDSLDEEDETVIVIMGSPTNATSGTPEVHTTTIRDDDAPPSVSFVSVGQNVLENAGQAQVQVQLSTASGKDVVVPLEVDPTGTSVSGEDFTFDTTQITIPAYTASQAAYVTLIDDPIDEEDELVRLRLGTPTGARVGDPAEHTITIVDNDAQPTVSFDLASQGGAEIVGRLTAIVKLSHPSSKEISVPFNVNTAESTATPGEDYQVSASPLVFPAGSTLAEIVITMVQDSVAEADELVVIDLGTPVNGLLGSPATHRATILGVATMPEVFLRPISQTTEEGVGRVDLKAQLTSVWYQDVVVPLVVGAGTTAGLGTDFAFSATSLVIPAGSLYTTTSVLILEDTLNEEAEKAVIQIYAPTNATIGTPATHTITIVDNDNPPTVFFVPETLRKDEASSTITVTVQLNGVSGMDVSVPFLLDTALTNAIQNVDFELLTSSPVVIPTGSSSGHILIRILDDSIINENDEAVVIEMSTPTNATKVTPYIHYLTIIDNDKLICPTANTFYPNATKLALPLYNTAPDAVPVQITDTTLFWPDRQGNKLQTVSLGSALLWEASGNQGNSSPTSISSDQWIAGADRSLSTAMPDNVKVLTFQFNFNVNSSDTFILTIKFNNGCFWSSQ